jgi:hypothetical protein
MEQPGLLFCPHAAHLRLVNFALRRSITFWSGIVVMGFICWAWVDSRLHTLTVGDPDHCVANIAGGIWVLSQSPYRQWSIDRSTNFQDFPADPLPAPLFRRGAGEPWTDPIKVISYQDLVELEYRHASPKEWAFFIPHWLLLLAVALPWSALLLWRARRATPSILAP